MAMCWRPSSGCSAKRSISKDAGQELVSRASSNTSSSTTGSATRWWPMSRLLFLSIISALSQTACSDNCGPDGAAAFGLVASNASLQLIFGNLKSGANNDCRDPDAPPDVISLTITGTQNDGTGLITMCAPRPDLMMQGTVPLVGALGTLPGFRLVEIHATANNCTYAIEQARPPLGTVGMTGACKNGTDKKGYALHVDGNISMTETCDINVTTIALGFSGEVAVSQQ